MNFINLTPHKINIHGLDGQILELPASGQVARVAVTRQLMAEHCEDCRIPLYKSVYGKAEGLPDSKEGAALIVSMLVREACPNRKDLFSPGDLIRDAEGKPIGCEGLVGNYPEEAPPPHPQCYMEDCGCFICDSYR